MSVISFYMKSKHFLLLVLYCSFFFTTITFSQTKNPSAVYRAEREKVNDLVHTKLKVNFDFDKQEMNGEAWITLSPHFYPIQKVVLDAKAMLVKEVAMGGKQLKYNYDDYQIDIELPKTYTKEEEYTLYVKYIARPEKVKQKGSLAITSAKGLYFINPQGKIKNKPTQVWTQGETESSSCWFPTIDAPNQKTSQEIYITVPDKYKTLSNGKLISQTKSGTSRTDYWKFDKKHAPYLFFMGVGEYEVVKDDYKGIPIEYYVEKEYAPYARDIFGLTPEMMGFFSEKLGIEYPWSKYSQIVGRDYVSGAMENTTAVIHGEQAYQKPGQLIDGNRQENTIAHELFHHWFGNLVTTESWSNLALNESFANYSEYLWREHKYGKTDADAHLHEDIKAYKEGSNFDKDLVRFYYSDKEDMFDAVSYNKGGAILHMLRNYLGDKAFFTGLKKYLIDYKFKAAEVHQLRLVLEQVTGKDLNWFFNQWFFGSGHPKIEVTYDFNTLEKTVSVNLLQTQNSEFSFPLAIDIYENGKKTRHHVFVNSRESSFIFQLKNKAPDLILVNADGVLLADFSENKLIEEYIYQLQYADNYEHKRNALLEVAKRQDMKSAFKAVAKAMSDDFYKIRILALENIDLSNKYSKRDVIEQMKKIAKTDKKTLVKAAAIKTLGKLLEPELKTLFEESLESQSYTVKINSLTSLYYIDASMALQKAKELPAEVKQILAMPLTKIYIESKDESELAFIANNVLSGMYLTNDKSTQELYKKAFDWVAKSNNTKAIENLVEDIIEKGNQYKAYNFDKIGIDLLRKMIDFQEKSKHESKEANLRIIKIGIAKLAE